MEKSTLSPAGNVLDSLDRTATELVLVPDRGTLALKGALVSAWHAVGLLFYLRVQPERRNFDAWVQDYFHDWGESLNVDDDSRREEREHLGMLQILDLLSEIELPSLRPEFYAGWRDRTARCRELRSRIHTLTGEGISESERDHLLYLLGLSNRLQHAPVEITVDVGEALVRFPALLKLVQKLWDSSWDGQDSMADAMTKCLKACRQ